MLRLVILALTLAAAPENAEARSVAGVWSGSLSRGAYSTPVELRIPEDLEDPTISFPDYYRLDGPLKAVKFNANALQAVLPFNDQNGALELSFAGDAAEGEWRAPGGALAFSLHRATDQRPYRMEEIRFANGDIQLAGEVILPSGAGPHPLLVWLHGSGESDRWWNHGYADLFARHGVASLIFDKRGCGGSSGDWQQVGFDALAADGVAAVQYAKERADIRTDAIGLIGVSQAGWIMPLAASQCADVKFIVSLCGTSMPVIEEGHYDYLVRLKDAGFEEAHLKKAKQLLEMNDAVTRTGQGFREFQEAYKAARSEPWFKTMDFYPSPSATAGRTHYRLIMDFDPAPILRGLDTPILWIYGGADKSVDTDRSVEILQALEAEQDKPWTVVVHPNANHALRVPHAGEGLPLWPYAPGHPQDALEWVLRQVAQ